MALETAGRTLMAGCSMMRLPALRSQHQTTAPTGHSTSAAKQKATKPRVGPTILQRHGLSGLPHSMHTGIGMHAIFPNLAPTKLTNPALIKPSRQPKNTSFFLDCKNNNKYKDTKRNPNGDATIITDHRNDSSWSCCNPSSFGSCNVQKSPEGSGSAAIAQLCKGCSGRLSSVEQLFRSHSSKLAWIVALQRIATCQIKGHLAGSCLTLSVGRLGCHGSDAGNGAFSNLRYSIYLWN